MRLLHLMAPTLLCATCLAAPRVMAQDLTFLHLSDFHVPHAIAQTKATFTTLAEGPAELAAYDITAATPSFILSTGDLNEFSGGNGWWEQYLDLWSDITPPVYHQLGNHDNTWRCARPALRDLHGSAFYAFERAGVKFIGWDTATPQDPRPSIAEEGLRWLTEEFARTPPEQPVVFFGHHALDGREFAGAYDRARLLDLLQTRNVVLMLVGHGHNARAWQVEGFDVVMGGSTFGKRPGFGIVSIKDGVLRVCHQYADGEMTALLEKPIPRRSPLRMSVTPADGALFAADDPLRWTVATDAAPVEARWTLDDERSGEMLRVADGWRVDLDSVLVEPGAHVLRVELAAADGRVSSRTVSFFREGGAFDVVWRTKLGGSSQATPLVAGERVYVGDNSGALTVLSATDGARVGVVETGGEVRSAPVATADGDTIVFGSSDGLLRAIDRGGAERWRCEAGGAIYGAPLIADGRVYVGTEDGDVMALDAATGSLAWRSEAPEYAIEQAPAAGDGAVFAGSWDRHAYALDASTGELRWRRPSAGSDRDGFVAWYYSPADCPPVFAEGNVFFADRAYQLTVFDADDGEQVLAEEGCVAVGPSADGGAVYVRHTDDRVSKRAADGSIAWVAQAPTGAVPTPPVEAHGIVWVLSDRGVLSALDAGSGRLLARQRVTPDLYAFAAPAFDGQHVYVADMAGNVTCLLPRWVQSSGG
ncbi:MAG: PQQ-binding-like beta-propeller repeat protein [Armatimonadota bacterium]